VQEPVAWGNLANWCLDSDRVLITDKTEAEKYHRDVYDLTPLYTTPPAAPVQEPVAQDVQEKCRIEAVPAKGGLLPAAPVQEPVAFLANGTRFKISYDSRQSGGQIHGIPPELGGRWVAFVAADDDCHLKLTTTPAAPVQEPVAWRYTDSRGHYRYRGYVPGFDVEYSLLKPQALYTTPPAAQRPDVDALVALARADEREACAKVCESIGDYDENVDEYYSDIYAAAIRARGNT